MPDEEDSPYPSAVNPGQSGVGVAVDSGWAASIPARAIGHENVCPGAEVLDHQLPVASAARLPVEEQSCRGQGLGDAWGTAGPRSWRRSWRTSSGVRLGRLAVPADVAVLAPRDYDHGVLLARVAHPALGGSVDSADTARVQDVNGPVAEAELDPGTK